MEDEDGFITSDAEPDSDWEVEDSDRETELGVWLEQLQSFQQEADHAPKKTPVNNRMTLTPKQVMDNFRSSVLDADTSGDVADLDAILGELCELETAIDTTRSQINTSLKETGGHASKQGRPQPPPKPEEPENHDDSFDALDLQLQNALSELSDIAGGTLDLGPSRDSGCGLANGHGLCDSGVEDGLAPDCKPKKLPKSLPQPRTDGRLSDPGNRCLDKMHDIRDLSPDTGDADSAFSDSASLPSSGSHVSVTTTSSQHSGSSANSGASGGTGSYGMNGSTSSSTHASALPIANVTEDESCDDPSSADQAAKLKAEKVRIALEKIKEANIKKLFIRAYTADGCSKSILVDEKMSVAQVCDILLAKNHAQPTIHWSLVEHLPELYMERILEDNDYLVNVVLTWTRDSTNKLLFEERHEKFNVFVHPELYLTGSKDVDGYTEASKQALVQEYFSDSNARIPDIEGMLSIKSEGKKAWKKFHCVLRASGIYYNPKGKGKSSKDLVCLQKLDLVEVYTALGWKKKYKAPTDFCFALKHPQIQKKGSKYIKYMCADDERTLKQWLVGIRMAKYGQQLLVNYEAVNNNIATWDSREHNPNPNMADYLDQQNKINDRVSYSDSLQDFRNEQGYNNNNSLHNQPHHPRHQHLHNNAHYTETGTLTKVPPPNGNVNYEPLADDDDEGQPEYALMSPKMKPYIPVTTSTLRQLTEVNHGTIKRSPKIYKKSKISPRKEPSSHLPLPPEPCDADEVMQVSVDADFPPPPSAEDLKALSAPGSGLRTSGARSVGVLPASPAHHARTTSVGGSPRHSVTSSPRHSLTGVPQLPGCNGDSPRHSTAGEVPALPGGSPRHSMTGGSPRHSQNMAPDERRQSGASVHSSSGIYPNSHSVPASPARSLSVAGAPPPPPLATPGKGHRRTSSVGSGGPPPPTKPKPPPPPKRNDNTHLVDSPTKVLPPVPAKPKPPVVHAVKPGVPVCKPVAPVCKPVAPPTPATKPPIPMPILKPHHGGSVHGHVQAPVRASPARPDPRASYPNQPTPQTTDFFSDLHRVLEQKQGFATLRKKNRPDPAESFPPPPPPQVLPSSGSSHSIRGDIDDLPLPPPPAELLEGLRKIQNTKKRPPPPPPKRSSETRLTKHNK